MQTHVLGQVPLAMVSIMKVCLTKSCVDSAERAMKSIAKTNSSGDNQTMINILKSELNSMEKKSKRMWRCDTDNRKW